MLYCRRQARPRENKRAPFREIVPSLLQDLTVVRPTRSRQVRHNGVWETAIGLRLAALSAAIALLIGCVRSADDPDKVAHAFTEALIGNQPGSAMVYTPIKSRTDDSFRAGIQSNAVKLAPCKQEKLDYQQTVVSENRRLYRVVFGNLCGTKGPSYTDLALTIDNIDGHWLVTDYAPQVFITAD